MRPEISSGISVGIDAVNLRRGGGLTHLKELIKAFTPTMGVDRIVVWGAESVLLQLGQHSWLEKVSPTEVNAGLIRRSLWQRFKLSEAASEAECDVLLVPGGSHGTSFRPVVVMCRNMLPFEWRELRRFGVSPLALKLILLRFIQARSFRHADGVIFLTEYARRNVISVTGPLGGRTAVIPHGLSPRFKMRVKKQRPIRSYGTSAPYRILYVSTVDEYKHQANVVEAVARLREAGVPLALDLVGPGYGPSVRRLRRKMDDVDPDRGWAKYHGAVPFEELHHHYSSADLGVFASSCENLPNILLESMAAGLPLACSCKGPMPEVLGDAGVYFDPEKPTEIAAAIRILIDSPEMRWGMANAARQRASGYSWARCAHATFHLLQEAARHQRPGATTRVNSEV